MNQLLGFTRFLMCFKQPAFAPSAFDVSCHLNRSHHVLPGAPSVLSPGCNTCTKEHGDEHAQRKTKLHNNDAQTGFINLPWLIRSLH